MIIVVRSSKHFQPSSHMPALCLRRSRRVCVPWVYAIDTVTDIISGTGMPGNLTLLQLSQHVGGDTRVYCAVPATIFDAVCAFPTHHQHAISSIYPTIYNGRGEKRRRNAEIRASRILACFDEFSPVYRRYTGGIVRTCLSAACLC